MFKAFTIYLIVAIFLFLKNLYSLLKCNYLYNALADNSKRYSEKSENYKFVTPIKELLHKAPVYCSEIQEMSNFASAYGIEKIQKALLQAKGLYYTQCIRSWAWLYYLLRRLTIFQPIHKFSSNKLIAIISCFLESFVVYLIGLYLDTSGIGMKILNYISSLLTTAIEYLK